MASAAWEFTPEKGDYRMFVSVKEDGSISTSDTGFSVISNTEMHNITSPLKQFKSGIPIEEIKCKENLLLILKHNGNPICVKPHSITQLNSRGYSLAQSCTNTLFLQNDSMTLPCYCGNNESLISGGYYVSKDSNIEIKYQRAIINDGFHGWEVEFFNPSEQSEYAFVYAYCREK